jgi:hypothetical protein
MRRLAIALVFLGACYEPIPVPPRDVAAEQRAAQYQAAVAACRAAEADPKAPADYVARCRAARWRDSGVMCFDEKLGERAVRITCTLSVLGRAPDFDTAYEKTVQHAAYAALSSGKTHMILVGQEPITEAVQNSTTPVTCKQRHPGLYALAAAANANQPDATTNCQRGVAWFSNQINCTTRYREPMPPPRFDCTGGEQTSTPISFTTRDTYELLTADEAAQRNNPALPAGRRPWSAQFIAQTFAGLR